MAALALAPGGCGDDSAGTSGDGGGGGGGTADGGGGGGGTTDGAPGGDAWAGNQPSCSGKIYACSDGKDNDGDGKIDAQDPECIGPCDNDEASFATGISGDNVDACKQDCFFDGNSGAGDDKCDWDLRCDPANPGANTPKACPYDPKFKNCPGPQSKTCIEKCRGLTPNGCDCFGCCEVYVNGQKKLVYLGSGNGCSTTALDKCATCTQVKDCSNDCGECELCLGKTIDDLPAKCFPATPDAGPSGSDAGPTDAAPPPKLPTCSDGKTPCLSNADCQNGDYCVTGCCIGAIQ